MPGAPVPECATFPSTEGSVDAELVCFDAAPSPLIRVVVYDSAGTPVGPPVFRDPITGAITAPAGSPIACPDSGIDVEILCLCDDGFDPPVPFIRQITYIEGTPSGPFDFELDGLTPYVLTGAAVKCADAEITGTVNVEAPDTSAGESIRSGFDRISGAGSTWSVGVDTVGRVQSVTFIINNRTGVFIGDDFGNLIAVPNNFDTYEWGIEALNSELEPTLSVAITAAAGDVTILWTEVA